MRTSRNIRSPENFRSLHSVREKVSYAIQSQYSASEKILALAASFQKRIEPRADVNLFYQKIFNIYTAEGEGLDIWGRILGIGRIIDGPPDVECFGFQGSNLYPFDQAPFIPDDALVPPTYLTLDDDAFRLMLLYKALANISASDAATQNRLLSVLIDTGVGGFSGAAYVLEIGTMVIRWVFETRLTAEQLSIFSIVGTLARGAGVGWELYMIDKPRTFGFQGSGLQPFNQAPFIRNGALILNRS